jgi:hypothetical protein
MTNPITYLNRLETVTTLDRDNKPLHIEDRFLQNNYRKPVPPEQRPTNNRTETRTSENGVLECRDIADVEELDQEWGKYWVIQYKAEKERTGKFYIGATVAAVSVVALVATGIGAAVGAAWAVVAGNLTVLSNLALAGGSAALGVGVTLLGIPKGYKKGVQNGSGVYMDLPRGELERVQILRDKVVRDWYRCP